ncbi:uncharacterized protein [Typha latifolia]|uniref:uncharacterized protein n=1 Tax=Typha latifolia TaxID=4733 RepID=UPI003C2E80A2
MEGEGRVPMEEDRAELGDRGDDDARDESLGAAASRTMAEDKNPSSPSSSSADSDSEDETAEALRMETLESALREQPLDYESHVQYIQCLRKSGQIEKLRTAREEMNKYFPLSPKLWQEWVKDEISLNAGVESFAEIEKLYERGVQEYLSVPLWCDYINFIQEHDQSVSQCSPAGLSKMRNLFERALTAAGLHIVEGSKIWEAYREFEQAIFLTISGSNDEEKPKQIQRIRALFQRQLSVPLVDLNSTLAEYKVWETEHGSANDISSDLERIPSNVASAYQKATDMYNARKHHEDNLASSDASEADKLQHFVNYIKFEESCGDPARVQILYERAVSEFPVSSDLWLGYTSYLDRTLKVPSILKNVYSKGTRNCPWVGELWVRYLLSLERLHASEEELKCVFEQSVQCAFPSIKEYLDLFLTRVDGLRRRISLGFTEENGLDFQLIRQTFMDAADFLSPQLLSIDDLLHLHAYWARLEANLGKDVVAARGVWENLIKKSGSMLEVWQQYIEMEIELGHISEARSIYKRCYSKRFSGKGSEDICHLWLRFEREYGTLDDFDLSVKKVTPRLQELMLFKSQHESKTDATYSVSKDTYDATQKRKMSGMSSNRPSPTKRRKYDAPKSTEVSDFGAKKKSVSTSEGEVKKDEVVPITKEADVYASDKKSSGYTRSKESKSQFYNDQCTAFISNINPEANEEHLRHFFSDIGGVTAIRLLRDKFTGKSRGLAYVEFSDNEHLTSAIAKNKQKLLGKRLSIARSDPKKNQKRASDNNNSTRGRDSGVHFGSDHGGKGMVAERTVIDRPGSDERPIGKNTFAAPRALARPLGWTKKEAKVDEGAEELKSNEEFRKMFLKK